MTSIIDTHAHIDQLEDLSGALGRAYEAGVVAIVAMSVDLDSMTKVLNIAQKYSQPTIYPALGVHPGMLQTQDPSLAFDFMRAHLSEAKIIGETGLDYGYKWVRGDQRARQKQKDSFDIHLHLARDRDLPIVIHSRGAWRDCLAMTLAAGVGRALFHWYSGPLDILGQILDAGFYVSTSPSIAYSFESQQAMRQAPLERILIETDTPVRYKDGENFFTSEPRDVLRTAEALARLKSKDFHDLLALVNANARTFFGLR